MPHYTIPYTKLVTVSKSEALRIGSIIVDLALGRRTWNDTDLDAAIAGIRFAEPPPAGMVRRFIKRRAASMGKRTIIAREKATFLEQYVVGAHKRHPIPAIKGQRRPLPDASNTDEADWYNPDVMLPYLSPTRRDMAVRWARLRGRQIPFDSYVPLANKRLRTHALATIHFWRTTRIPEYP